MKKLDWVVLALVATCSLLPLLFLLQGRRNATVEITVRGETLYTGKLDQDAVIQTPDGRNVIRIQDGAVWMEKADCPDGACLRQGRATAFHPIVCLPNEVIVRLIGEEASVDAVTS